MVVARSVDAVLQLTAEEHGNYFTHYEASHQCLEVTPCFRLSQNQYNGEWLVEVHCIFFLVFFDCPLDGIY